MRTVNLCAASSSMSMLVGNIIRCVTQVPVLLHDSTQRVLKSFVQPVRVIRYFLVGFLLSAVSAMSCADTVPPTYTSAPPMVKYNGYTGVNFDTPAAACTDAIAHSWNFTSQTDGVFDHIEPYTDNVMKCFATFYVNSTPITSWWSNVLIMRSCDGTSWTFGAVTCMKNVCPANSTGTPTDNPTICTCDTGYVPDAAKTSCVSKCPVTALSTLPADDACALALDNLQTTQAQKYAACGTLTPAMQTGKSCLASKLGNLGTPIPLEVTADIRNITYQAHFREIWDKMEALVPLMEDPAMQTACAARRAEIAAEKGCDNAGRCVGPCYPSSSSQRSHCLRGRPARPSPNDAQHTQGNAIDVSSSRTIAPLESYLNAVNPPQTIQQFLDAPTNCNLIWGGTFTNNSDPVHFRVR